MNGCRWGRKLFRLFLYSFFALGTVVLAGSLSPEKLVRKTLPNPASAAVRQMADELPADRRTAWNAAAETDPVMLFRLSAGGR